MISEQIRNNNSAELQQSSATIQTTVASIRSGLAAPVQLPGQEQQHKQHQKVILDDVRLEATGSDLLHNRGRLTNPLDTSAIFNKNDSTSPILVLADEDADDGEADGDPRNGNNYNYKKLPPGVTTKNNMRLFVKHRYRDHSSERPMPGGEWSGAPKRSDDPKRPIRLVPSAFPTKLHEILQQIEADEYGDIIGWMPHGRYVMYCYFSRSSHLDYARFCRQYHVIDLAFFFSDRSRFTSKRSLQISFCQGTLS
jgi:hypothetical protein